MLLDLYINIVNIIGYINSFIENKTLDLSIYNIHFNKKICREFMLKNNFPTTHILSIYDIYNLNSNNKIVIKPIKNTCCGNDINIMTINEFKHQSISIDENKMIEKFVNGKNYRIFIYKYNVKSILYRIPAYVIGDGYSNIYKLIEIENKKRPKKNKINIINVDGNIVPIKDEIMYVNNLSNYHKGGSTKNVIKQTIHPDNIKLFESVAKKLKLKWVGLDFIIPDITKSYKFQVTAFNEIEMFNDVYFSNPDKILMKLNNCLFIRNILILLIILFIFKKYKY